MDDFTPLPWDYDLYIQEPFSSPVDDIFNDFPSNVVSSNQRETPIFNPFDDDWSCSESQIDQVLADLSAEPELTYDPRRDDGFLAYLLKQSMATPPPLKSNTRTILRDQTPEPRLRRSSWMIFDKTVGRERRPLLYEFLQLLLDDPNYASMAEYVDRRQGIFILRKPKEVARLWKDVKGRSSNASKRQTIVCLSLILFSSDDI